MCIDIHLYRIFSLWCISIFVGSFFSSFILPLCVCVCILPSLTLILFNWRCTTTSIIPTLSSIQNVACPTGLLYLYTLSKWSMWHITSQLHIILTLIRAGVCLCVCVCVCTRQFDLSFCIQYYPLFDIFVIRLVVSYQHSNSTCLHPHFCYDRPPYILICECNQIGEYD